MRGGGGGGELTSPISIQPSIPVAFTKMHREYDWIIGEGDEQLLLRLFLFLQVSPFLPGTNLIRRAFIHPSLAGRNQSLPLISPATGLAK